MEALASAEVIEIDEEGLSRRWRVRLPRQQLLALRDARLKEIAAGVALAGFPMGQAPLAVVLQHYGAVVMAEVAEEQIAASAAALLAAHGITPAAKPQITVESCGDEGDLIYAMHFEVMPKIAPPRLPPLRLQRVVAEADAEAVAAELAALALQYGAVEEVVSHQHTAADGDIVVCDVTGRIPIDLLPNGVGHGAAAGQPGTIPVGWELKCSPGLSWQILRTGRESGLPVFDLALRGKTERGGFVRLFFCPANNLAARPGQLLSLRAWLHPRAGSLPPRTALRLGFSQRSATDFLLSSRRDIAFGPRELSVTIAMAADPAVAFARPIFEMVFREETALDFLLCVGPVRVFAGAEDPQVPPFPAGCFSGLEVPLGSEVIAPGFSEQLLGIRPGESRDITIVYPPDHPQGEISGRRALFTVVARSLKRRRPRPLDDDFARSLGYADRVALEAAVRHRLQHALALCSQRLLLRDLFEALLPYADFPIPTALIAAEIASLRGSQGTSDRAAAPLATTAAAPAAERDHAALSALAARRVRLRLLLEAVADAEGIAVSDNELAAAIRREAARTPAQEAEILAQFRRDPEAVQRLRQTLRERKTTDFLLARAEITPRHLPAAQLIQLAGHHFPPPIPPGPPTSITT